MFQRQRAKAITITKGKKSPLLSARLYQSQQTATLPPEWFHESLYTQMEIIQPSDISRNISQTSKVIHSLVTAVIRTFTDQAHIPSEGPKLPSPSLWAPRSWTMADTLRHTTPETNLKVTLISLESLLQQRVRKSRAPKHLQDPFKSHELPRLQWRNIPYVAVPHMSTTNSVLAVSKRGGWASRVEL